MRSMTRALALAIALLWSSSAWTYPIIVGVEGTVFQPLPASPFKDGDPVKAFYVYDSEATVQSSPPDPNDPFFPTSFTQSYVSAGFPYGVYGTVGSVLFAMSGISISLANDVHAYGCFEPRCDTYSVVSASPSFHFAFFLWNHDATAYDVSDYPIEVPPVPVLGSGLGQFGANRVDPYGLGGFSLDGVPFGVTWILTRIYRVPEPSTLALLSVGLVGLAFARRRMQ